MKRSGHVQTQAPQPVGRKPPPPPMTLDSATSRAKNNSQPPPFRAPPSARRPVPAPFSEEPTRQVNDELLAQLRAGELPQARPSENHFDEPTRLATVDPHAFDDIPEDGATRPGDDFQFLQQAPRTEPGRPPDSHDDLTTTANLDGLAAMERTGRGVSQRSGADAHRRYPQRQEHQRYRLGSRLTETSQSSQLLPSHLHMFVI